MNFFKGKTSKWMLVLISILFLWQSFHYFLIKKTASLIPSSIDILKGMFEIVYSGEVFSSVAISALRIGVGFGLAAITAIILGALMGYFKKWKPFSVFLLN